MRLSIPFQDRVDHWDLPDDAVMTHVEYSGTMSAWVNGELIVVQGGAAMLHYRMPAVFDQGYSLVVAPPDFMTDQEESAS